MSETTTGPTDGAPPRHRSTTVLAGVLVVVLATVAALAVFADSRAVARTRLATATGSGDLLETARQDAVDFTTYDYRSIKADFDRFLAQTKPPLHAQYAANAPDLETDFAHLKVHSVGTVVSSGIVDETPTTAKVLVAVNDLVVNSKVPKGQTVYDRLAFDMVKVGDAWFVSQVHEL